MCLARLGLIPAWAGKTPVRYRRPDRRRAHPRVGGENTVALKAMYAGDGSSPRGRGKPLIERRPRLAFGLIPAWAGKTCPPRP